MYIQRTDKGEPVPTTKPVQDVKDFIRDVTKLFEGAFNELPNALSIGKPASGSNLEKLLNLNPSTTEQKAILLETICVLDDVARIKWVNKPLSTGVSQLNNHSFSDAISRLFREIPRKDQNDPEIHNAKCAIRKALKEKANSLNSGGAFWFLKSPLFDTTKPDCIQLK